MSQELCVRTGSRIRESEDRGARAFVANASGAEGEFEAGILWRPPTPEEWRGAARAIALQVWRHICGRYGAGGFPVGAIYRVRDASPSRPRISFGREV